MDLLINSGVYFNAEIDVLGRSLTLFKLAITLVLIIWEKLKRPTALGALINCLKYLIIIPYYNFYI